jgi:N-acyl amino acid synthase of PEP-CTERM/exosortase system
MPNKAIPSFHDFFEMVPVTTDAQKEAAYRLRYHVFCLETGLWNSKEYPDGLEYDEYDQVSEQYLIRHRKTGVYAATTRLILNPELPFPTERYAARIDRQDLLEGIPRQNIAEASRFCICDTFKRRHGEKHSLVGLNRDIQNDSGEHERRSYPHLMFALIACLLRTSKARGITHWFAFMELPFIRLLKLLGITFIHIGQPAYCHGFRYPCIIALSSLLDGVREKSPDMYNLLWKESFDSNTETAPPNQTSDASSLLVVDGQYRQRKNTTDTLEMPPHEDA